MNGTFPPSGVATDNIQCHNLAVLHVLFFPLTYLFFCVLFIIFLCFINLALTELSAAYCPIKSFRSNLTLKFYPIGTYTNFSTMCEEWVPHERKHSSKHLLFLKKRAKKSANTDFFYASHFFCDPLIFCYCTSLCQPTSTNMA